MEVVDDLPENAALSVKNQKVFKRNLDKFKAKKKYEDEPGVVYIGHIPRGFYEHQMKAYFSQFGTVNKIILSRSKKTGGYKGYGFIEFASATVAKVVAETMNNYLMFHKLLKCEFRPADKVHPHTFKNWKKPFKFGIMRKKNMNAHNSHKDVEHQTRAALAFWRKTDKTIARLKEMGIEYEFTNFVNLIPGVSDEELNPYCNKKEDSVDPESSTSEEKIKTKSRKKKEPEESVVEIDKPVKRKEKKGEAVSSPSISSTNDMDGGSKRKRKAKQSLPVPKKHKKK